MKWIVGLGNPGTMFKGTRHNVGYEVVDELLRMHDGDWKEGRGEYLVASLEHGSLPLSLVKPLTSMNDCGVAVSDVVLSNRVDWDDLLVVCDDFNLPLGRLRLRPGGSDGGHNGLYSIIYQMQTERFPRLRCGIASEHLPARKELLSDFVLTPFEPNELPTVKRMIARAAEAASVFVEEGMEKSMSHFNRTD